MLETRVDWRFSIARAYMHGMRAASVACRKAPAFGVVFALAPLHVECDPLFHNVHCHQSIICWKPADGPETLPPGIAVVSKGRSTHY